MSQPMPPQQPGWPQRPPQGWPPPPPGARPPMRPYPVAPPTWSQPPNQIPPRPGYAAPAPQWQTRPRRSSAIPGILIAGGVLVVGMIGIGLLALIGGGTPSPVRTAGTDWPPSSSTTYWSPPTPRTPTPRPTPRTTSPTPPPTSSTPKPKRTGNPLPKVNLDQLPKARGTGAWRTVQRARIYQAKFPAVRGCPKPAYMKSWAQYKRFTSKQLNCVQKAMRPILARKGLASHRIPHSYYGESGTSGCGRTTASAFYCSAGKGRIYFGKGAFRGGTYMKLWVTAMVGHEYGHHVQHVSGFTQARYRMRFSKESTRRNELQATCIAWGLIRHQTSYRFDGTAYQELLTDAQNTMEDGIHGSRTANRYWSIRGAFGKSFQSCNTWVVGKNKVKAYS